MKLIFLSYFTKPFGKRRLRLGQTYCTPPNLTIKTSEWTVYSSETSVLTCQTKRHHLPTRANYELPPSLKYQFAQDLTVIQRVTFHPSAEYLTKLSPSF